MTSVSMRGEKAKTRQMTAFEEMTQNSYLLLIFPFKVLVAMSDVGKYKFIPFLVLFSGLGSWQHV